MPLTSRPKTIPTVPRDSGGDQGILPLAMRPRRLSGMVGQSRLISAIRNQVARSIPRAWMFVGPSGSGKTTLARIVAIALQCSHQTVWGEPCNDCCRRNQQGDYLTAEINASEISGVEDIGKLAEGSRYRPIPPSRYRVYILDEAQMLTANSQNLLLKHFEDTPATTVWIICTTVPNKILVTLRRRCVIYPIPPLSIMNREQLLHRAAKRIGLTLPIDPLVEAANMAGVTSPGWLLMAVEKYASGLRPDEAVTTGEVGGADSRRVCAAMTRGDWTILKREYRKVLPEEVRWIRASAIGWMRENLFRESSPKRQRLLVQSLQELTTPAPLEDTLLYAWLLSATWKICRRFHG